MVSDSSSLRKRGDIAIKGFVLVTESPTIYIIRMIARFLCDVPECIGLLVEPYMICWYDQPYVCHICNYTPSSRLSQDSHERNYKRASSISGACMPPGAKPYPVFSGRRQVSFVLLYNLCHATSYGLPWMY